MHTLVNKDEVLLNLCHGPSFGKEVWMLPNLQVPRAIKSLAYSQQVLRNSHPVL